MTQFDPLGGVAPTIDVVDVLLGHHQQIKLLFGQMDNATGEHKQELFTGLVALLAVHENVEQLLLHPMAQQELPGGDDLVTARLAEEQQAKDTLTRLYDLGVNDPGFDEQLLALRDDVTAHATAEEESEFAGLRKTGDPELMARMAATVRAAAALSPVPWPAGGPANAMAGKLQGPPEQVFEQVREVLAQAIADKGGHS